MSDDKIAIKVEGISKDFRLPHERSGTVKGAFTSILRTFGAQRTYDTQHALQDVSFEVKKGEFFGIVGRNGSGKSTLLKMLAGIYQPTKGKIGVRGRLVPFIELGVGFNGELTGRENVYLNGALVGFTRQEIDAQYDDIVEFAELGQFMDQKLKNYSSGMQVRLAFSLAIRADADILLVDEVLAVGDANFQRKCYEYFRQLKKNKKTVVFVSHDMNAVREYCDRAIMIEKSHLVAEGKTDKIANKYTQLFIDEARAEEAGKKRTAERWGDGAAEYTEVKITPTKIRDEDKSFVIDCKVAVHEELDDPILGFVLKNGAGDQLFGTNTKIKRQQLGVVKAGQVISISWEVPNIVSDGSYSVNVAIHRGDGLTECDHLEDAAEFKVYRDEKTPYAIGPDLGLDISVV
jgi:ABC-2 type transport system ATP-binding protein